MALARFLGLSFTFSLFLLGPTVTPSLAQDVGTRPDEDATAPTTGEELYLSACANCHGALGAGMSPTQLGFADPPPADFTNCTFASREPHADWEGITYDGGPTRGFSRMMPAFGGALTREEVTMVVAYVKDICKDKRWPPGEFNLPLALGTEKAFPEDEMVFKTTVDTKEAGSVMNKYIYEKRFGPKTQIELVVPFGWQERVSGQDEMPTGDWEAGLSDVAIGVKHVLFHNIDVGSIASFTFETIFPTGDESDGFGKGFTIFEPFVTFGQLLPFDAFVQVQTGVEIPTGSDNGPREGLFRVATGKTFVFDGEWGRAWSPMVEFLAAREFEDDATAVWDILPQMQVTLNQRQHIMANFGVRFPLTETDGRDPQLLFYVLWDWYDGGFFEGW